MIYFATGEWGRFAQYTSAFTVLLAVVLFGISIWLKKDAPEKSAKLKHAAFSLIALISIVFLILVLLAGVGIALIGLS